MVAAVVVVAVLCVMGVACTGAPHSCVQLCSCPVSCQEWSVWGPFARHTAVPLYAGSHANMQLLLRCTAQTCLGRCSWAVCCVLLAWAEAPLVGDTHACSCTAVKDDGGEDGWCGSGCNGAVRTAGHAVHGSASSCSMNAKVGAPANLMHASPHAVLSIPGVITQETMSCSTNLHCAMRLAPQPPSTLQDADPLPDSKTLTCAVMLDLTKLQLYKHGHRRHSQRNCCHLLHGSTAPALAAGSSCPPPPAPGPPPTACACCTHTAHTCSSMVASNQ